MRDNLSTIIRGCLGLRTKSEDARPIWRGIKNDWRIVMGKKDCPSRGY